jgi:hypothetical protein
MRQAKPWLYGSRTSPINLANLAIECGIAGRWRSDESHEMVKRNAELRIVFFCAIGFVQDQRDSFAKRTQPPSKSKLQKSLGHIFVVRTWLETQKRAGIKWYATGSGQRRRDWQKEVDGPLTIMSGRRAAAAPDPGTTQGRGRGRRAELLGSHAPQRARLPGRPSVTRTFTARVELLRSLAHGDDP